MESSVFLYTCVETMSFVNFIIKFPSPSSFFLSMRHDNMENNFLKNYFPNITNYFPHSIIFLQNKPKVPLEEIF